MDRDTFYNIRDLKLQIADHKIKLMALEIQLERAIKERARRLTAGEDEQQTNN